MEIQISKKPEITISTCVNWDVWALPIQISWWSYRHIDSKYLSTEEVPDVLNVPFNPRILGGVKFVVTGKCYSFTIQFLCFHFHFEIWKWTTPSTKQSEGEK